MQFKKLTTEQSQFFEENGYLVVPNALDAAMVERVTAAVERIYEEGCAPKG